MDASPDEPISDSDAAEPVVSRLDQLIADGLVQPASGNLTDLPAPQPGPSLSAELQRMRDAERY